MTNPLALILSAAKTIFAKKRYKIWFAVISAVFISAYILFPVWHMPGNDVASQLSALTPYDYFLFIVLSTATALLVLMQIFLFSRSKKGKMAALGQGGAGAFSSFFAAILATAACFSCVAAIFGFLGAGSVFFITENKPLIVTGVIALIFISLYFGARRVEGICKKCENLGISSGGANTKK